MTPRWLELKIPPPVVAILCGGSYTLISEWFPGPSVFFPLTVSLICILMAFFFGVGGVIGCWRQKTTIHPWNPEDTVSLVTTGVFQLTRNPMYLALLLCVFAWVIQPLHPASALALVVFVLYLNCFQIVPEERALADKFGDAYAAYRTRVRRWI